MKSSDDRAARGSGGASVGDAEKAAGKTAAEIRAADVTEMCIRDRDMAYGEYSAMDKGPANKNGFLNVLARCV